MNATAQPAKLLGIPLGDFGLVSALLLSLASGFLAFFATCFLAIVALLCWEAVTLRRAPLGALAATLATWLIFKILPPALSEDGKALVFIVPSVLAFAALSWVVYFRGARAPRAQSTISSSFANWLSRRAPSSPTTTRSSIRTPSSPGR